jgi:hypothetical protein
MIELYIGEQLCDLKPNTVIAPTYQAYSVADLDKVKFSFTNTFILPFSNRNNEVFENSFRVQSTSSKRFQANDCKLIVDGTEILAQGVAEYLGSNNEGYIIVVYGKPIRFFDDIEGLFIEDLDALDQENYYWNNANIVDKINNSNTVQYPIIDWHGDSPNAFFNNTDLKIDTRYILPCYPYHLLLEKIFEDYGLTLENETELEHIFQDYKLMMCANMDNDLRRSRNPTRYLNAVFAPENLQIPVNPINFLGVDLVTVSQNRNFYFTNEDRIRFGDELFVAIKFTIEVENQSAIDALLELDILSTRGLASQQTSVFNEVVPTGTHLYEFTVNTFIQDSSTGPAVTILYRNTGSQLFFTSNAKFEILELVFLNMLPMRWVTGNGDSREYITPSTMLPKMQLKDVIKQYMTLTGSILIIDDLNEKAIFKPFNKIVENKAIAKDWTDKLDMSKKPEIKHTIGSYGIANILQYTDDDFKPLQSDLVINSSNQNLQPTHIAVDMKFAATSTRQRLQNIPTPNIPIYLTEGTPSATLPKLKPKPRILLMRAITTSSPIDYTDGTNTTPLSDLFLCHFIDASQPFNLGFGNNMKDLFYQWLESILNDTVVLNDDLKLLPFDIKDIDFSIPVYFNQFNAYFYINKITNFRADKPTKVELIKI